MGKTGALCRPSIMFQTQFDTRAGTVDVLLPNSKDVINLADPKGLRLQIGIYFPLMFRYI